MLVKKELDAIQDTFAGVDGGLSFMKLKGFLKVVSDQAKKGVPEADEVLTVVRRFHKLILIASRT